MLQTQTISPTTLELLTKLMQDEVLADFVLVGGTALSLQLGHRISIDLDLFSTQSFDEQRLAKYLTDSYNFETDYLAPCTIRGEIEGVQIDCIAHEYPWVENCRIENGIRLAGLMDIAAMKLNAIAGSGTRIKDFIDIAYLSSKLCLQDMLFAYEKKYKANALIPLKAICFWEDINKSEPVKILSKGKLNWQTIEKRLSQMQREPDRIFPQL